MVHNATSAGSETSDPADASPPAGWASLSPYVAALEREGKASPTFGRLPEPRQRAIVEAILEEALERGPAAVNIKSVAARAGVAVGSLYQYFPDRNGLLDFAVELCVRYLVDFLAMGRPYLLGMPLREALSAYLSVGLEWGRSETMEVRFLGRAAYQGDPSLSEPAVRPIGTAMRELTRDILRAAADRGELRPDLDLEAAARLVNVLAIALADGQLLPFLNVYWQTTDESMPAERVVGACVDFVLVAVSKPSVI